MKYIITICFLILSATSTCANAETAELEVLVTPPIFITPDNYDPGCHTGLCPTSDGDQTWTLVDYEDNFKLCGVGNTQSEFCDSELSGTSGLSFPISSFIWKLYLPGGTTPYSNLTGRELCAIIGDGITEPTITSAVNIVNSSDNTELVIKYIYESDNSEAFEYRMPITADEWTCSANGGYEVECKPVEEAECECPEEEV